MARIRSEIGRLLDALHAIEEAEEGEMAGRARDIIARSAELLETNSSLGVEQLLVDISGKGLFDWRWSPETEAHLEAAATPLRVALLNGRA